MDVILFKFYESVQSGEFSLERCPFVRSQEAKAFKLQSHKFFVQCGGQLIFDYFESNRSHVRTSIWKDLKGYNNWQKLISETEFIKIRREFHQLHGIECNLIGPFETKMKEFYGQAT